jgi:hypothetical protein
MEYHTSVVIPDLHRIKENTVSILIQKIVLSSRKYDPGCFFIPDLWVKKAPETGSATLLY